jgi:hypothetical protein
VLVLVALLARPALGAETVAVLAVGDPPNGPDLDLAELTHQLRAACRDRAGNVLDVPSMRGRLLGQLSGATVSELDRAYGGALAVYQNGEFESATRTLRAIVEDLEGLPESAEAYSQWIRARLRLAHASLAIGQPAAADEALLPLLRTDLDLRVDPEQYSPNYRKRLDDLRARVKALPRRRLTVLAEGREGTLFVNGRDLGRTPATVILPAGTYRIGGADGALRVPTFQVDLANEDRTVVLDFGLAEALRPNAGPGLAVAPERRAAGIIRAGAWLGADRLVVATVTREGSAAFLLGSMYDVRRGALLREGAVRMNAGSVPAVNLAALASFLLTGQSQRDVKERTPEQREVPAPPLPAPIAAAPAPKKPEPAPAPAPAVAPPPVAPPPVAATPPTSARAEPTRAPVAPPAAPALPPSTPPRAAPAQAKPTTEATSPAQGPSSEKSAAAVPATPGPGSSAHGGAALLAAPAVAAKPRPDLSLPEPALGRAPSRASAPRWMRPAAWVTGGLALGFGGLAVQQGAASNDAYSKANAMLGPNGLVIGDPDHHAALVRDGDAAKRNAWISAGVATGLAVTAGILGWKSWPGDAAGEAAAR